MLKNRDIIEKLNLDDKLSLIADGNTLFTQGNAKAGVPRVNTSSWDEVNAKCGNLYPPFAALANSWNADLVSVTAADIAARAKTNAKLLYTPKLRVKSNPYTEGISEDPYFVRTCVYNVVKSFRQAGIMPCLTGCTLEESDFKYLDERMDLRTVREYFFSPYKVLAATEGSFAVLTSYSKLEGTYADVNTDILGNMLGVIAAKYGGYVICGETESELSLETAVKYTLTVGGNPAAIKQAVINYNYINESISTGDASGNDLDSAVRDFSAISEASVDELADKVVDFALSCASLNGDAVISDELSLSVSEESAVLLKNRENILPIKRKSKVAIIGDTAFINYAGDSFAEFFKANGGCEVVGEARGYNLADERNDNLLDEARTAAKNADYVLLFIGVDEASENKKVKLPANRLALADAIYKVNQKVIAIITTAHPVDMGFDEKLPAVLLAPFGGRSCNEALTNILLGIANPSGRLANTYYANTDERFLRINSDKKSGQKMGSFIGYRFYDTAKKNVKYPFGFGLSYTLFSYSNLTVNSEYAEVTVKNTGKAGGSEVIQLYVGKQGSNVVRPLKELKSFAKVFLKAGESKTVRLKINTNLLAVYDEAKNKNIVESGEYTVYVGSSVSDIKLTGKLNVSGDSITNDNKKLSDYIAPSSNVLTDGYTLKDVSLSSKKGRGAITCGIIATVISLLGLAVMFALNYLNIISIRGTSYLEIAFIALICVFAVFLIVIFVGIGVNSKAKKRAVTIPARKADVYSRSANPLETLFDEQFKEEEEVKEKKKEIVKDKVDEEQEALKYCDSTLDLSLAGEQLALYAKSRGISISTAAAAKILAAMVSSRLVLIKSRAQSLIPKFLDVLSGYFFSDSFIEDFSGVRNFDEFMGKASRVLSAAPELRQNVYIAAFTNTHTQHLKDAFMPLIKYVLSPNVPCTVKYGYDKSLTVSPNVWFMFGLDAEIAPDSDELVLFNSAAVVDINLTEVEEDGVPYNETKFLSSYQLVKFANSVAEKYPLDEDKGWKKIDKLEKFVNAHSPYHIGNKVCLRTERFASAILACGGEQTDAIDCTVASVLLPTVICQLKGKLPKDENLVQTLENIFGEDYVQECKNILNAFGQV